MSTDALAAPASAARAIRLGDFAAHRGGVTGFAEACAAIVTDAAGDVLVELVVLHATSNVADVTVSAASEMKSECFRDCMCVMEAEDRRSNALWLGAIPASTHLPRFHRAHPKLYAPSGLW
ncbi:MAG: hypothetical protein IPM54_30670 [Polyangiaceae bacterium]|nr:hypothetical protein [Polyangiaceae bacterium]